MDTDAFAVSARGRRDSIKRRQAHLPFICVSISLVRWKLAKSKTEDGVSLGDLSLPRFTLSPVAVYVAVIILLACQQELHPDGKSKAFRFDHFDETRLWLSPVWFWAGLIRYRGISTVNGRLTPLLIAMVFPIRELNVMSLSCENKHRDLLVASACSGTDQMMANCALEVFD